MASIHAANQGQQEGTPIAGWNFLKKKVVKAKTLWCPSQDGLSVTKVKDCTNCPGFTGTTSVCGADGRDDICENQLFTCHPWSFGHAICWVLTSEISTLVLLKLRTQ
eukprot:TRINITY_DN67410_c2_g1_i1.p1 TRINITY_DN67410_c2_g1~~TRINITY_DN67410_c2_g1_i1.p1  ORF type:complete len:107 (+),score=4.72 TRINITY_DN67410_c2_g1_i1:269-589(+)